MHDLGGVQGFGGVEVEANEPVFHAEWERRTFRVSIAAMMGGHARGLRHAIERMDPVWYLSSPYYEHWLTAIATGLVEAGVIDKAAVGRASRRAVRRLESGTRDAPDRSRLVIVRASLRSWGRRAST